MQGESASPAVHRAVEAARGLVATWVETFNTRDPERIAALYAADASLHGTSKPILYLGRDEIRSYFRGTSTVSLRETHFAPLCDDSVLAVGTYQFARTLHGREVAAPARFTFVLARRDGAWFILHHHSSAEPS